MMSHHLKSSRPALTLPRLLTATGRMLSTDFCPSLNRWVYWLKNPFWVLMLAVVGSALCGVFLNPWILTLTALLLAVVAVGTVLPWLAMRGITCQVMFDVRRVAFGQPALVRLRIQNRWPLPVWGLSLINGFASDHAANQRQLSEGSEGIAFARVPGWSTIEYVWSFVPVRRGLYPVNGAAEIETSFPFGLFRARRRAHVEGWLIVWPETVSLIGKPDAAESQSSEDAFSDRRVGEFGDVLGTRPFREGDSLRRVHWAQTARQQTLIVTERQAPLTTCVRIVLDLSPQSHPPETREATVEHCIRIAASLCASLHGQHGRVELQLANKLLVAGRSTSGLQQLMDALAVAEPADARSVWPDGKGRASHRDSRFQINVTTTYGRQSSAVDQTVVVTTSSDSTVRTTERSTASPAWITSRTTEPLSQFATAWRKAIS